MAAALWCVPVVIVVSAVGGSSPQAAGAASLPVGRPLTIAWAGDTTLGSSYGNPPDNGFFALREVAPVLRAADISAVNSEGTYGKAGTSKCGGSSGGTCFAFQAPAANAGALHRAGVDIVNLANNHAFDFGAAGMGATVSALKAAGVKVSGRPGESTVLDVDGAKVAFVGFASYPWSASITDLASVRALCRSAAKRANVVVAFFHGGAEGADRTHVPYGTEEYLGENRGSLRAFAHAAVDGGADLVLGSGPHVLRGMERYKKRLIAYSLGNFAGYKNFGTGGVLSHSGILRATVSSKGELMGGRFESLELDGDAVPHPDRAHASARLISLLSKADFGSKGVTVTADGTLAFPGAAPAR